MGRNVNITQAASMVSIAVNIPAASGAAVTVWSLISSTMAGLALGAVDISEVMGFCIRGTKVDNTSYGAFVYGGENTSGNGGATGGNSYCAAGADLNLPVEDPAGVYVVAIAAGSATPRVIEVYFHRGG